MLTLIKTHDNQPLRCNQMTDKTHEKIGPCPFCGHAFAQVYGHSHRYVRCDSCTAEGPSVSVSPPTSNFQKAYMETRASEDAIKLWNRRAEWPALAVPVSELWALVTRWNNIHAQMSAAGEDAKAADEYLNRRAACELAALIDR